MTLETTRHFDTVAALSNTRTQQQHHINIDPTINNINPCRFSSDLNPHLSQHNTIQLIKQFPLNLFPALTADYSLVHDNDCFSTLAGFLDSRGGSISSPSHNQEQGILFSSKIERLAQELRPFLPHLAPSQVNQALNQFSSQGNSPLSSSPDDDFLTPLVLLCHLNKDLYVKRFIMSNLEPEKQSAVIRSEEHEKLLAASESFFFTPFTLSPPSSSPSPSQSINLAKFLTENNCYGLSMPIGIGESIEINTIGCKEPETKPNCTPFNTTKSPVTHYPFYHSPFMLPELMRVNFHFSAGDGVDSTDDSIARSRAKLVYNHINMSYLTTMPVSTISSGVLGDGVDKMPGSGVAPMGFNQVFIPDFDPTATTLSIPLIHSTLESTATSALSLTTASGNVGAKTNEANNSNYTQFLAYNGILDQFYSPKIAHASSVPSNYLKFLLAATHVGMSEFFTPFSDNLTQGSPVDPRMSLLPEIHRNAAQHISFNMYGQIAISGSTSLLPFLHNESLKQQNALFNNNNNTGQLDPLQNNNDNTKNQSHSETPFPTLTGPQSLSVDHIFRSSQLWNQTKTISFSSFLPKQSTETALLSLGESTLSMSFLDLCGRAKNGSGGNSALTASSASSSSAATNGGSNTKNVIGIMPNLMLIDNGDVLYWIHNALTETVNVLGNSGADGNDVTDGNKNNCDENDGKKTNGDKNDENKKKEHKTRKTISDAITIQHLTEPRQNWQQVQLFSPVVLQHTPFYTNDNELDVAKQLPPAISADERVNMKNDPAFAQKLHKYRQLQSFIQYNSFNWKDNGLKYFLPLILGQLISSQSQSTQGHDTNHDKTNPSQSPDYTTLATIQFLNLISNPANKGHGNNQGERDHIDDVLKNCKTKIETIHNPTHIPIKFTLSNKRFKDILKSTRVKKDSVETDDGRKGNNNNNNNKSTNPLNPNAELKQQKNVDSLNQSHKDQQPETEQSISPQSLPNLDQLQFILLPPQSTFVSIPIHLPMVSKAPKTASTSINLSPTPAFYLHFLINISNDGYLVDDMTSVHRNTMNKKAIFSPTFKSPPQQPKNDPDQQSADNTTSLCAHEFSPQLSGVVSKYVAKVWIPIQSGAHRIAPIYRYNMTISASSQSLFGQIWFESHKSDLKSHGLDSTTMLSLAGPSNNNPAACLSQFFAQSKTVNKYYIGNYHYVHAISPSAQFASQQGILNSIMYDTPMRLPTLKEQRELEAKDQRNQQKNSTLASTQQQPQQSLPTTPGSPSSVIPFSSSYSSQYLITQPYPPQNYPDTLLPKQFKADANQLHLPQPCFCCHFMLDLQSKHHIMTSTPTLIGLYDRIALGSSDADQQKGDSQQQQYKSPQCQCMQLIQHHNDEFRNSSTTNLTFNPTQKQRSKYALISTRFEALLSESKTQFGSTTSSLTNLTSQLLSIDTEGFGEELMTQLEELIKTEDFGEVGRIVTTMDEITMGAVRTGLVQRIIFGSLFYHHLNQIVAICGVLFGAMVRYRNYLVALEKMLREKQSQQPQAHQITPSPSSFSSTESFKFLSFVTSPPKVLNGNANLQLQQDYPSVSDTMTQISDITHRIENITSFLSLVKTFSPAALILPSESRRLPISPFMIGSGSETQTTTATTQSTQLYPRLYSNYLLNPIPFDDLMGSNNNNLSPSQGMQLLTLLQSIIRPQKGMLPVAYSNWFVRRSSIDRNIFPQLPLNVNNVLKNTNGVLYFGSNMLQPLLTFPGSIPVLSFPGIPATENRAKSTPFQEVDVIDPSEVTYPLFRQVTLQMQPPHQYSTPAMNHLIYPMAMFGLEPAQVADTDLASQWLETAHKTNTKIISPLAFLKHAHPNLAPQYQTAIQTILCSVFLGNGYVKSQGMMLLIWGEDYTSLPTTLQPQWSTSSSSLLSSSSPTTINTKQISLKSPIQQLKQRFLHAQQLLMFSQQAFQRNQALGTIFNKVSESIRAINQYNSSNQCPIHHDQGGSGNKSSVANGKKSKPIPPISAPSHFPLFCSCLSFRINYDFDAVINLLDKTHEGNNWVTTTLKLVWGQMLVQQQDSIPPLLFSNSINTSSANYVAKTQQDFDGSEIGVELPPKAISKPKPTFSSFELYVGDQLSTSKQIDTFIYLYQFAQACGYLNSDGSLSGDVSLSDFEPNEIQIPDPDGTDDDMILLHNFMTHYSATAASTYQFITHYLLNPSNYFSDVKKFNSGKYWSNAGLVSKQHYPLTNLPSERLLATDIGHPCYPHIYIATRGALRSGGVQNDSVKKQENPAATDGDKYPAGLDVYSKQNWIYDHLNNDKIPLSNAGFILSFIAAGYISQLTHTRSVVALGDNRQRVQAQYATIPHISPPLSSQSESPPPSNNILCPVTHITVILAIFRYWPRSSQDRLPSVCSWWCRLIQSDGV